MDVSSLFVKAAQGAGVLFISSLLYILGVCVYRIWFHPLSKYPGPFWAKLTNVYASYHSWRGDLHIDMWRCHDKYGDHIRYGPNIIIFNTTTAAREIYLRGNKVIKSKGYLSMMHRVPNTITQRDKKLHAQQRRLLSNGFSDAALRSYEESLASHIQEFCQALCQLEDNTEDQKDSAWSPAKKMSDWCDYLMFDVILDIVYGFKTDMVTKPDNRPLLEAISTSNVRVGVMIPLHFIKNTKFDRYLFTSAIIARYKFIGFIRQLIAGKEAGEKQAEEKGSNHRRSIYDILKSANDGEGLTTNQIAAESTNLLTAGSDTTATALSATFFYLSRNPAAYSRARSEVLSIFKEEHDLTHRPTLNKCTYLKACIDESLRMSPPVPSSLFREVELGGAVIDDRFVPAGVDIGTGVYCIQHNPAYFPDPFKYIPERWTTDGPYTEEQREKMAAAFMPFSIGTRQCIGKGLATMELMSVLARVLWEFEFRIADGQEGRLGEGAPGMGFGRERNGEFQLYDHVVAAKNGPMLQFRRAR